MEEKREISDSVWWQIVEVVLSYITILKDAKMGNASSIEPTKTIFLDIDGKKEKVRGYSYFYSFDAKPLHVYPLS